MDAQAKLDSLLQGRTLLQVEGEILRAALAATQTEEGSNFSRAAKLLGFSNAQSIVKLLNQHPDIRAEFPARSRI